MKIRGKDLEQLRKKGIDPEKVLHMVAQQAEPESEEIADELVDEFDVNRDQELSDEEIQKMIDEGRIDELIEMGIGKEKVGENPLESAFKLHDYPMRMRLIAQGNFYDVLATYGPNNELVSAEILPLDLKLVYPEKGTKVENWAEAAEQIPGGWEVFKVLANLEDENLIRVANENKVWILVAVVEQPSRNPYQREGQTDGSVKDQDSLELDKE
jgi:hypothetical protein